MENNTDQKSLVDRATQDAVDWAVDYLYPPTPGVYRTEWGNPHTAGARAGRNNGQFANKVAKNRARNKAARKARRK